MTETTADERSSDSVFSEEEKRKIAGRSRTLLERIDDQDALTARNWDESDGTSMVEEWEDLFPSESAFERRLERDGITREDCRNAINADTLASDEPLPEWIEQLEELAATIQSHRPEDVSTGTNREATTTPQEDARHLRFAKLSAVVAKHARDRLPSEPIEDVLSDDAIETMAQWLRVRFGTRFTRILYVEFKTYVAAHDRELAFADPEDFDDFPTTHYENFLEYIFDDGFVDLCVEYPVFARLVTTQIRQWNDHLQEFCRRLRSDGESLADRFGIEGPLGDVTDIRPLADDTHGDGRAVMKVEFESGLEAAYKPRSVAAGETYYRVLERLDERLSLPDFRTPTYLVRDGYGWMEWIEYEESADQAAVERYYQRAGSLVCLGYFLEFSDCQYENVIVQGEHPVLVDAETVLHPHITVTNRPPGPGVRPLLDDSVLLTALLPHQTEDPSAASQVSNMMAAISGFSISADTVEIEEVQNPRVKAVNTDVMSVEHETARLDRGENIPSVDGVEQPPDEYVAELVHGFTETYETIVRLRDEEALADELGFPDAFESIENRCVYRPTLRYATTIRSLSSHSCLSDGARFGIEMERLIVPFCDNRIDDPWPWALYDAERIALNRLDPPRLTAQPDTTALKINGSPIGVDVGESGIQRSRRRIDAADRADMNEQIEYIRGCLGFRPSTAWRNRTESPATPEQISDDRLRTEATTLFDHVREAAIRADDEGYHWASVAPFSETDRLTLQPADHTLYSGHAGIGLLGAALYRITNEERYLTFTRNAIRPIREAVQREQGSHALRTQGGALGIGSVAYSLGAIGDLLDDREVLEEATRTATFLTMDGIESDDQYDVIGGSAGTILGLLAVYARTGESSVLSKAIDCGDHLLSSRTSTTVGSRAWETLEDTPPLAGFGHGTSGIAYALIRLSEVAGRSTYRDAAIESLEYESEAFSVSDNNWVDYRDWTDSNMDQWCHGRSGIGLARLGMAEYVSHETVERGISRAVTGFPDGRIGTYDHLCCGNAGRAEFLLELEERRDRSSVSARGLLGGMVARKREVGAYRTMAETDRIPSPTFFHGLSGIAYAMLRVTNPRELPSVLLWE